MDDAWRPMDSNINDRRFYESALERLQASGRVNRMQQMVYPWLARMNDRANAGIRG